MKCPESATASRRSCSRARSGSSGVRVSNSGTGIGQVSRRRIRFARAACHGGGRGGPEGTNPGMFTSQSLRAVVRPGALAVREQRLDDVVHHVELRGTLDEANAPEMARRVDAALAGG